MAKLELAFAASVPDVNREGIHEEIVDLAFEFWLAREFRDGSPEEDLLRARRVIKARRKPPVVLRRTSRLFLVK